MATRKVRIDEKEIPATTASSEGPLEANETAVVVPERNLTRAIWTIVYGVALPCIPVIVISFILLYIIFTNRLHLNPGLSVFEIQSNNGQNNGGVRNVTDLAAKAGRIYRRGGQWAYHVQYNPSTITTIASWTSRIVPYLQSSIMALVAFFAARHIVLKSKHGDESQLLNPEQLALLIGTLGGSSFTPLKDVLLYKFGKKGKLINPLPAAVSALTAITVMALIIPIIDTWFGISTSVETVTQLSMTTSPNLDYGRVFSYTSCPAGPSDISAANGMLANKTAFWPCNVQNQAKAGNDNDSTYAPILFISRLAEGGNIAVGMSNYTKIYNYTDLAGNDVWYLGSPAQSPLQDYLARTFATTSQCRPMTLNSCQLYVDADRPLKFQCNDNFIGSLNVNHLNASTNGEENNNFDTLFNVGLAFSGNAALTEVTGQLLTDSSLVPAYPEMYTNNPLYYGAWAIGFPASDISMMGSDVVGGDDSYGWDSTAGGIWLLNCSTTVYEMTYTWVNGTVASSNLSLASPDMAALLTGPFVVGSSKYIQNSLSNIASIAGSANNSVGIANTFAAQYSKLLLAYSIGALETQTVLAQQNRTVISGVARVPLIPLYLLLATKALYVVAVIVLAIAAYAFTHPAEIEIVKDQLSIKCLTSACFDHPDTMQQFAAKQLQSHFDETATHTDPTKVSPLNEIDGSSRPLLQPAATALPNTSIPSTKPAEPKIGLIPAVDGTWQWVVKMDGVWNSVKPLVKAIVLSEAQVGDLGAAGNAINAHTGKSGK